MLFARPYQRLFVFASLITLLIVRPHRIPFSDIGEIHGLIRQNKTPPTALLSFNAGRCTGMPKSLPTLSRAHAPLNVVGDFFQPLKNPSKSWNLRNLLRVTG